MNKSLFQYLRRNIKQLTKVIVQVEAIGHFVPGKVLGRLETIRQIYSQQNYMYDNNTVRVEDRIVSLSKPYVRPIVRGKTGKDVEFGMKGNLSCVDDYLFLDHINFSNFHKGKRLPESIEKFRARFGKYPFWSSGDQIYDIRENRRHLKGLKQDGDCMPPPDQEKKLD